MRKLRVSLTLFTAILFVLCNIYYMNLLHQLPFGIHDWAQSDRLSIAFRFYDDGMNFFKPATFNLWSENGITDVECPMQAYMAAAAGHIFGREYINCSFRIMDILFCCIGLMFLFLIVFRKTRDFLLSALPPLFIFCSPMFAFYTGTYLPDPVATSISFIAFYFMMDYIEDGATKKLIICVLFFLIATLMKTSLGLYLFGFAVYYLMECLVNKREAFKKDLTLFISLFTFSAACIIFYFFYNRYLNTTYHSGVFLAKIWPFKDMDEFKYYINEKFLHLWIEDYFTRPQYVIYLGIISIAGYLMIAKKKGLQLAKLLAIFFAGTLVMGWLLGNPLLDHDYYIISIFFPLIGLSLAISMIIIYNQVLSRKAMTVTRSVAFVVIAALIFFAKNAYHDKLSRFQPRWETNGAALLASLHISNDEHIIALDENAPNTSFIYFNRRGYQFPNGKWIDMHNVYDIMANVLHLRTVVCRRSLGTALIKSDTAMYHFNTLALKDSIAVFQLKN